MKLLRKSNINSAIYFRKPIYVMNNVIFYGKYSFPICPKCGAILDREYQRYCDRCGQALNWEKYNK